MIGSVSTALSSFMTGPAGSRWLQPASPGPIFTFGNIEGRYVAAEGGEQEALAKYQQTILVALRETNDALTGAKKAGEIYMRHRRAASQCCATTPVWHGCVSRTALRATFEVYSAENDLFNAELTAVDSGADRILELVAICKALGAAGLPRPIA